MEKFWSTLTSNVAKIQVLEWRKSIKLESFYRDALKYKVETKII